jgi:hypothetical protein
MAETATETAAETPRPETARAAQHTALARLYGPL